MTSLSAAGCTVHIDYRQLQGGGGVEKWEHIMKMTETFPELFCENNVYKNLNL